MNAVAITGIGVVTAFGAGLAGFRSGLREGRSGVGRIRAFETGGFPIRIASEVDTDALPLHRIEPRKQTKLMNRSALFAAVAAHDAVEHAGLERGQVDPFRFGIAMGAGGMGAVDLEFIEAEARTLAACEAAGGFDWGRFFREYQRTVNPLAPIRALPNGAAANLAILHGARGPNLTIATACASGTQAIGEAQRVLLRGDADVMLAGGTDAMINPTGVLGFHLLGTLSRRNDDPEGASRPFERDRDGFVLGEGAAILVLERAEFARARGARPLAFVAGYAANADAYRMTDERPDASGPAAAMRRAIEDAELEPADVDYINAHGTGTVMNDRVETRAIRAVFGDATPPVSSTKSMTGHLLAGAGALEATAAVLSISEDFLPPTINYDAPDPECDLDYVPNRARVARVEAAASNSFGFGGQNATLVITREA